MALTTIQSNNKLVVFRKELVREYVRDNLFSPYMGDDVTSIIRSIQDLKKGGEQINVPIVRRLSGPAIATGTLVGNEEQIDNFGFRAWIDWARHAVTTNKAEDQKDSADVFGEAKPLLSNWGKELQRDEIILAMASIPSNTAPVGLGTGSGARVNGILYSNALTADKNTWHTNNIDRIQYGNAVANYVASNHASSLANIAAVGGRMTAASVQLMKRRAKMARPRIQPYQVKDEGREYFVLFVDSFEFRDLAADATIIAANTNARAREGNGMDKNPIFQDGDLLYNGVIIREIPEMNSVIINGVGAAGINVSRAFMCGQQALAVAWGRMPSPTFRKEDDYGFIEGVGVEMAYGIAKLASAPQATPAALVDWGIYSAFFASIPDA